MELRHADVARECRDDETLAVCQKEPQGEYPARISDRIAHRAATTPDTTWMAESPVIGRWLGATETAPLALFTTEQSDQPGNVGIPSKGLSHAGNARA